MNKIKEKSSISEKNFNSQKLRHKPLRDKSFTLTELLIVLAVIFILMAFLLPALSKVRQKAKEIACANNMKQTGLGINMYAVDFKGYVPQRRLSITNWKYQWVNLIVDYIGFNYSSGPAIFNCPAGKPYSGYEKYGHWLNRGQDLNRYTATNYNNDGMSSVFHKILTPSKFGIMFDFKYPPCTIPSEISNCMGWVKCTKMAEMRATAGGVDIELYRGYYEYRHNNRINVLFADFHIEAVPQSPLLFPKDVIFYYYNRKPYTF